MIKRFTSLFMMFSALAILLGHNMVGHDHHTKHLHIVNEQNHSEGQNNHGENNSSDFDLGDLFASLQHGANGITFLSGDSFDESYSNQQPSLFLEQAFDSPTFILQLSTSRLQTPPYKFVYYNSLKLLPSGLRAPPIFIV